MALRATLGSGRPGSGRSTSAVACWTNFRRTALRLSEGRAIVPVEENVLCLVFTRRSLQLACILARPDEVVENQTNALPFVLSTWDGVGSENLKRPE